jgi:large subunit ribosomal protein L1
MGKIRTKVLGTEEEQEQKKQDKIKREQKKLRKTHVAGMKGGERLPDMGTTAQEKVEVPTIEELDKELAAGTALSETPVEKEAVPTLKEKPAPKKKRARPYSHSQKFIKAQGLIDKNKLYPPKEGIELVKKATVTKFDATMEVHINVMEKGIKGTVILPHSTGKELRVAIADEKIIADIEKGQIDFDILIATPEIMPKLTKVAKILGPKGLMPNPKAGTITTSPEKLAGSFSKGQVQYKTEPEFPIIHFVIGKASFKDEDLIENLNALLDAIGRQKIVSVFVKSTMSPSVKITF